MKPESGVFGITSANDGDSKVGDREKAATDRVRVAGAVIEILALDEDERQHRHVSNATDL